MSIDKNSFFWRAQRGELPSPRCADTLSSKFLNINIDNSSMELEFEGKPEFTNPSGNIQGGFLAAMLDDAMAANLASQLQSGEYAPTVNMNIQYFRPAEVGKLKGYSKVDKKGRNICYLSGRLEQNEKIVATATASAIITKM